MWAFKRRVIYGAGALVFLALIGVLIYALFIYAAPTCFDSKMNGGEQGIDCGGSCVRVCAADVVPPIVSWSQAFEISKGSYNAVAYVENRNPRVGTKELAYTFTLVDAAGATIAEKRGVTFLPPDSVYPIFEGRIATGDRIPARTFLTLAPVTAWEEFTSTRSQFVVNTRALSGTDSAPRLDVSLTNTSLEDARDVEIVATIFDSKRTALTASRTVVPLFEGRAEKNVTFTWPLPIAKTLRSCEVPSDVILAIDLSGSMNNEGGVPPQPITASLKAASDFALRLKLKDQLGLATFASEGTLARTLSNDKTAMSDVISRLTIAPAEERGTTNIGAAIARATEEFGSTRHADDARKVLVLFTDGKATSPDPDPAAFARSEAEKAKAADITIFTIGLGGDLDETLLAAIASSPAHTYRAPDTRTLDQIYRSISSSICEDGAAIIEIIPKIIGELNDAPR